MTRHPLPGSRYTPRIPLRATTLPLGEPGGFARWYRNQIRPPLGRRIIGALLIALGVAWIVTLGFLALFGAASIPKPGDMP